MSAAPPPPPPHAPERPSAGHRGRLLRRRDGKILAGVAAGLADHLDVDPVLVRVGFVLLAVWPFPGFGALVYLALVLLLPVRDDAAAPPRRSEPERGMAFYAGVALLAVAVLALLGTTAPASGVLIPLVLIGLGVALWVSDRDAPASTGAASRPVDDPTAAAAGPGADPASGPRPAGGSPTVPAHHAATGASPATQLPPPSAERWTTPAAGADTPVGADAATATTAPSAPPQPLAVWERSPARLRSPLGRWTVGAAMVVGALTWTAALAGVPLRASGVLASVLAALGAGLLVGSVAGRARWLAWLAAPVAVLALTTAAVEDLELPWRAGVGERTVVVDAAEAAPLLQHRLGAGRLVVDLTGLSAAELAALDGGTLDVALGAGELEIRVPDGLRLDGHARVEVGELRIDGVDQARTRGGLSVDGPLRLGPADAPTLEARVRVGAGQAVVVTQLEGEPAAQGASPPSRNVPALAPQEVRP